MHAARRVAKSFHVRRATYQQMHHRRSLEVAMHAARRVAKSFHVHRATFQQIHHRRSLEVAMHAVERPLRELSLSAQQAQQYGQARPQKPRQKLQYLLVVMSFHVHRATFQQIHHRRSLEVAMHAARRVAKSFHVRRATFQTNTSPEIVGSSNACCEESCEVFSCPQGYLPIDSPQVGRTWQACCTLPKVVAASLFQEGSTGFGDKFLGFKWNWVTASFVRWCSD